jgi:hypothetical protein
MRLTTFWHVLVGLNMGLFVLSWSYQNTQDMLLNAVSILCCIVAGYLARIRELDIER